MKEIGRFGEFYWRIWKFKFRVCIVCGFLKMVACEMSPKASWATGSDENDVEIEFIDEDNLLLTCISVLEHPETEEEIEFDYLAESSCSRQNHIDVTWNDTDY